MAASNRSASANALFDYIEVFYNQRRHSTVGDPVPPATKGSTLAPTGRRHWHSEGVNRNGSSPPRLYRRYVSYAAEHVTPTLVRSNARARVLIGIPSYDETGNMHRARAETLENGLLGCVAGLRGVGGGGTFEGVALYAESTTGPEEWAVYERVWRGQDKAR